MPEQKTGETYRRLGNRVDELVGKYGAGAVITFLAHFETRSQREDYQYAEDVIRIGCLAFKVTREQVVVSTEKGQHVANARRVICYFLSHAGMKPKSIANLLDIGTRTVHRQLEELQDRIRVSSYDDLQKGFERVKESLRGIPAYSEAIYNKGIDQSDTPDEGSYN